MKNFTLSSLALFFSGCVIIFPNHSKVKVDAPDDESIVKIGYVLPAVKDLSEVVFHSKMTGDSVVKVNNQKPAVVIVTEKEGYKSSSKFLFRTDYNPFTILDLPLWVATVGFVPYLLKDQEMKPLKKYSYSFFARPVLKYPTNNEKNFYLRIDTVSELASTNFYCQNVTMENLYRDGFSHSWQNQTGKPEFHANTNSLKSFTNSRLKNWGFSDSTEKAVNSITLKAEITKIKILNFNGYLLTDIGCTWTAHNSISDEKIYSKIINYTSEAHKVWGYFNSNSLETHRISINKSVEDAFESTLIEFLNLKDFNEAGTNFSNSLKNNMDESEIFLIHDSSISVNTLKECGLGFLSIHNKKIAGTATLIDKRGYAITNFELLMHSEIEKKAISINGSEYKFEIIKNLPENNLCLIKLILTDTIFKINYLNSFSSPSLGDEIYLVNIEPSEDGVAYSLNKGIISSVYTRNGLEEMQIDISYNSWNSGSAIVNKKGQIIGIISPHLKQSKSLTITAISSKSILQKLNLVYK